MPEMEALRSAFETIYRNDLWNRGSGPGSSPVNTIEYRAFLERFLEANAIRTVTDFGCGDWQFSHLVDWSAVNYTGMDVVPALVQENAARYGSDKVSFVTFSSLDSLPGGDLFICKEVLQHLPNAMILECLNAIRARYRFSLLTNTIEPGEDVNQDIPVGDWRPLRLDLPPFSARGATVFTYFVEADNQLWRNAVFLLLGDAAPRCPSRAY